MRDRVRLKTVLAACSGHVLEWYDFSVYAFVATKIAPQIFPSSDETVSYLATFGAFGVGFLSRPVGGLLLGWFGDRFGSRAALLTSFALMGVSTLGIGLVPTYQTVGWIAPLMVVFFRLTQGLSAGGEYAVSASYLVAWAPEGRRGLFGSFQQAGSATGALAGSAIGTALSFGLSPEAMASWGWRAPFVLGALLVVLGLYLRRAAPEAPERDFSVPDVTDRSTLTSNLSRAARLFCFAATWAVPYYLILFYMPTFMQRSLGLGSSKALSISTIGLIAYVLLVLVTGRLSDAFGRRRTIALGGVSCFALGFIVFPLLVSHPDFWPVLCGQLCLNGGLALISGPAPATIVEMFPPRRLAWMNGAYGVALALFGGFTPAAVTWIVGQTGSATSPNIFLGVAGLGCAAVMMFGPETAFLGIRLGTPSEQWSVAR